MIYVLDSSVALKWVLPESDSPKALQLCDDFRTGAHTLLAPDIFPVEVGHALTRAERQGRLTPPAAEYACGLVLADSRCCILTFPSRRVRSRCPHLFVKDSMIVSTSPSPNAKAANWRPPMLVC